MRLPIVYELEACRVKGERRPRQHPGRKQREHVGVRGGVVAVSVLDVLRVRRVGEALSQLRRRSFSADDTLDDDRFEGVRQVHHRARVLGDGPAVHGVGCAAVVPDVINPEAVDRHQVWRAVRAGRRQPVGLRLLEPRPDLGPREHLLRRSVSLREADLGCRGHCDLQLSLRGPSARVRRLSRGAMAGGFASQIRVDVDQTVVAMVRTARVLRSWFRARARVGPMLPLGIPSMTLIWS